MDKCNKSAIQSLAIVCLFLMVLASAGCINKIFPKDRDPEPADETSSSRLIPEPMGSPAIPNTMNATIPADVTSPAAPAVIDEISPEPYITPDPYRLPYRNLSNRTTGGFDADAGKIPEFSKKYVLRSNSTALRVNVPKGPLVIDLTFSPLWADPDQTKAHGDSYSFVYSSALVTVYNNGSSAVAAQEGYGGVYSTDLTKKITIYREGTYIITLTGSYIDVTLAVTTGAAADKPAGSRNAAGNALPPEEEMWV